MDSDLDNALIQSEALYCLRREQLVNLCKRRGIKARGKAPELADLLRQSIQVHQASSSKPISPALAELPHGSPRASSPSIKSPPMPSQSPVLPPHTEQSSPLLHQTVMNRTTSRLSTHSRSSHVSSIMTSPPVDSPSSPVGITTPRVSGRGYARCASPQPSLPDMLPMQMICEIPNEGTDVGIHSNSATEKESPDPTNTSEDALDWLISAINDQPNASEGNAPEVRASARPKSKHISMDDDSCTTKKERPASAMELRRQNPASPRPTSPQPRPTTSLDDTRAMSHAHAHSAASSISTPFTDIPAFQAVSDSRGESGALTTIVPASLRSCSPVPSSNENQQHGLLSHDDSHQDKTNATSALTSAANLENVKDISITKFPKVSKMARRMRSILESTSPAQATNLNEFLHSKSTKRAKYAQAEYEGVADPVLLRQALYSSSRMPTTTVPVIHTSRAEADENKPPMAIERARSLRTTRKFDATRRSVQRSAQAAPMDKLRLVNALR